MKIGIAGGTFDPIHTAHAYLMEECRHLLQLDRLMIIPTGDPPHKDARVTAARHRLAMTELALSEYDLEVSDLEVNDPEVSYTYRTLQKLKAAHPEDDLYFIMGSDSLIKFLSWRKPDLILQLAALVCFDRPNYRTDEVDQVSKEIQAMGGTVIRIDSLELDISSTDIRQRVAEGNPHRSFLHPTVYDYIHKHGLYQEQAEQDF